MTKVNIRWIKGAGHLTWRERIGTKENGKPLYRQRSEYASSDKKTAELCRAKKQLSFDRISAGLPIAQDMTWKQCWTQYVKEAFERLENPDVVKYALEDFNAKIKLYSVAEFNSTNIDQYVRLALKEGKAPAGIKRYVGILINLGKYIKIKGILAYNPAENVSPIKGVKSNDIKFLNDAEINIFLEKAWGKYYKFGIIGLYLGFRPGEILMASFSDIDFDRNVIKVIDKKKYNWHPKTYEQRTVRIPSELLEQIKEWKKTTNHDLLVCNDNGTPIKEKSMGSLFRRILKRKLNIPHLIPYVFRHTFAAKYIFENPDKIYQLSKILGHKSVRTTQNHYEHLVTGYAAEGMDKISFKK